MIMGVGKVLSNDAQCNKQTALVSFETGRFRYAKYVSHGVFLIDEDLTLLDSNEQGDLMLKKYWIGIVNNKIHFSNRKMNSFLKHIMLTLGTLNVSSKSFIVRCDDSIFRTCILLHDPTAYDSDSKQEYLLEIKSDLPDGKEKINILAQAFSLSISESSILNLMVDGLKPKEIAYEKDISLFTVRSHLRTLYAKMDVRNYNDCLILAVRLLS